MKIKTSELIGPALDWAVAKCEGSTANYFTVFDQDNDRRIVDLSEENDE
jgi:hypothetical protein